MTEEIIIDGVNVAGCEFLRHCVIPDNEGCKIDDSLCCDVGNCYYKQLKRLEFELKVTKADYEASEQENKELKIKLSSTKCYLCGEGFLTSEGAELYEEKERYRSALEEIKEVLKFYADSWVDEKMYPNLHYDNTKAKEGLSRINEVLNESN